MNRLIARDKHLYDGDRKFCARGVSYGTFRPNSSGEPYPEPAQVRVDFALMRELGANVVRTYEPPPAWMFEEAAGQGLRLMVGLPWPSHLAFLDSREMTRDIRNTVRRDISEMRRFGDAIFAYTLGNEIRSDIVRWHGPRAISRFLAELYDIGKQADPEGLFTYANYPSTEYLDLSFLDVVSFNVYLHREPDFRRYLTHLLSITGRQPLVLSETGMDTIREGEQHQAELLSWQSRAAFELGLAGFMVFAFTDEWYRGGREITDWAFGLVTGERAPKRSFAAVANVFKSELPPPLAIAPKVSVVVAAYNAQATLGACLSSLAALNYPDYETIVADDGSSDETARIAEAAGVRLLRLEHRGLASARNAAAEAATGRIVAFIDADARADRDWLYHLVETLTRRDAPAAGGPNFALPVRSPIAAAFACAPGAPREVRAGDDRLAQLCGCNMAFDKAALEAAGGFDPAFTVAGDDVDLSWRITESGATLALAAGAVVIHERRTTLGNYLRQQRGYGAGEGLLLRKYPLRNDARDGLYGGSSWLASLLGGARIYYGAFGRGLFQTLYRSGTSPLAQVPLTAQWAAAALALFAGGFASRFLLVLGCVAIMISVASASLAAALTPPESGRLGVLGRAMLALLYLLGPLVRSCERERVRWSLRFAARDDFNRAAIGFRTRGELAFVRSGDNGGGEAIDPERLLDAMHTALVRRGLAVAASGGLEAYDLAIVMPPAIRVPLNALETGGGRLALRWRVDIAARPALAASAGISILLLAAGTPWPVIVLLLLLAAIGWAGLAIWRLRLLPALLDAAAAEVRAALNFRPDPKGVAGGV